MATRNTDDADKRLARRPRYAGMATEKSAGATYTPAALADFVAGQMLRIATLPRRGSIRVLDPAAGDGALLDALITALPPALRKRLQVRGHDIDQPALAQATERLRRRHPDVDILLEHADFLDVVSRLSTDDATSPRFDLVIANPPYVRTQIMGAQQAQQLARQFGLTGRVDLYYPFLLGISRVLSEDGVAGVITSNRFMSTRSGQAVRREMLSRFRVTQVWDMGDSKPFGAAVLPAVLLARGAKPDSTADAAIGFSSLYETREPATTEAADALSALAAGDDEVVGLADGRRFRVRHGVLDHGDTTEGVWRLASVAGEQWLATVAAHTRATFRHIGKVRVGVKSTADKVFIRDDWDDLPDGRPELLRPLITRHAARRFKADMSPATRRRREILYPHVVVNGRREAADLGLCPNARAYLERHRSTLEARSYLIAAGRHWYELWVPQDPAAWSAPKLVFPDISEKPVFWMDTEGHVVNGECYWLQCEREHEEDLLWLALAVANSSFIEAFYDHRFNNKLYAGRRRFITQYVEQFPLPDPTRRESAEAAALAREIHDRLPGGDAEQLAHELDARIWALFGLAPPAGPS